MRAQSTHIISSLSIFSRSSHHCLPLSASLNQFTQKRLIQNMELYLVFGMLQAFVTISFVYGRLKTQLGDQPHYLQALLWKWFLTRKQAPQLTLALKNIGVVVISRLLAELFN
jgi:predicted exporter